MRVADGLEVYLDCDGYDLMTYNPRFRKAVLPLDPPPVNLLLQPLDKERVIYKGPQPIVVDVPAGDSDDLEQIQMQTVGLTLLGMLILLREVAAKSSEQVCEHSDFSNKEEKPKEDEKLKEEVNLKKEE